VGRPSTPAHHAFLSSNSTIIDIGTLGGTNSDAWGINAKGQVAGNSNLLGDIGYHAFLYNGSTMNDLGTLGGVGSAASGINNKGQVVGCSTIAPYGDLHAFLYSDSRMIDLGSLGGWSEALAINDNGEIVGTAKPLFGIYWHAFLYTNSEMIDLNTLIDPNAGWELEEATGVNDVGQIVCNGIDRNRNMHALLLTPTPEPSCIAFLGAALLSYAGRLILRWRNTKECGMGYRHSYFFQN
jgi:probable HAF family extracellular repeat protein